MCQVLAVSVRAPARSPTGSLHVVQLLTSLGDSLTEDSPGLWLLQSPPSTVSLSLRCKNCFVDLKSRKYDCLDISWTLTWTFSRHAKVDGEKTRRPQPYTENHSQLRDDGSKRNSLPQGRLHQFVHYQIVSSENTHMSNIVQTEQIITLKKKRP